MSTAIIGVGRIGRAVATDLTHGGEEVILVNQTQSKAEQLAAELGERASVGALGDALDEADSVIFAVWLDPMKQLIEEHQDKLDGKVVIDPSNPIAAGDDGQFSRTLPDGVSSGSVIASLVPPGAHYVKAFGTVGSDSLSKGANRRPDRAVLFYATDDDEAAAVAERLISAAGFDAVKVGGVSRAIDIEVFGRLHQNGGLDGKLLNAAQAREAVQQSGAR